MPHVLTTCPFCGCGCGLYLQVEDEAALGTVASVDHPVSRGRLCAKGWHAHEVSISPRRLLTPLVRRASGLEEASWEEALTLVARRLREIAAARGAESVGFLGSARATNEENYLLSKLARICIGTNNVDYSARLEALPSLFDLRQYRRFTLPGAGLGDIEEADLLVLWQTDPVEEHPAAATRVLAAMERGVPVIEVAARASQLGRLAGVHLAPLPGAEAQLAGGLMRAALAEGDGVAGEMAELSATVDGWTPEKTESVTGVPASKVAEAGRALCRARRPLIIYARGATLAPQGTELLLTLAALGRACSEGDESWSPMLSLSNYANSQGARDVGLVPYLLPGYQDIGDSRARERVAAAWGAPPPAEAGMAAWEMLEKARALYVMGDDPVRLLPDGAAARRALGELEFLVVQETFLTATAAEADVVLPAATFAEKEGTVTSTERRVQRVRRAAAPPGEARPELEVLCELSQQLGRKMSYGSAAEVMTEIAAVSPIYEGLSYSELERSGGLRWPLEKALGTGGREAASEGEVAAPAEQAATPGLGDEFPFVLAPDYSLEVWSTDSFVSNAIGLRRQKGADRRRPARVLMSPSDAEKLGVRSGTPIRVLSQGGEARARAEVDDGVRPGVVLASASALDGVHGVLRCNHDPETGVPRLQPGAVRIEKA